MSKVRGWALMSGAVVALMGFYLAQGAAPSEPALRGTVTSSDGKALEGVTVSARRVEGTTVTTTVYTGRDGSYFFPPLTPPQQDGRYNIWAQAVGFEAGRSETNLLAGRTVEQNLVLKPLKDFSSQLSGSEWMDSLPESTAEDRRIKRVIGSNCLNCHQASIFLQNRFDATGWAAVVSFMAKSGDNGQASGTDALHSGDYNGYIYGYKDEIVSYLARVRGPDSAPLDYKPRPRPTGEAAQIVVTEYDVSPGHLPGYSVVENGSDWSLGTPSRIESGVSHSLVWDPQGYVWLTDNITPGRTIVKLDPKTGQVTGYKELSEKGLVMNSHDIFVDHLGNVWLANGIDDTLDEFDPRTEKFHRFPRPDSVPPGIGRWFDEDSKGNIWQGIQGRPVKKTDPATKMQYVTADPQQPGGAVKLDPKTGEYTFYKSITPALTTYGAVVDAEDNVWLTRTGRDLIEIVNSHTGKVSELNLSARDKDDIEHTALDDELAAKYEPVDEQGTPWQKAPRRLASDKKNGTEWFALSKSSGLAKIDIHTRKVTEYPLPYRYSFPYALAVDKNHMVWVAAENTNSIFKFNPFTKQFTEYRQPSLGADMRSITVDNSTEPPTVWVPSLQTSKIVRFQFRGAAATQAAGR